MVTINSLSAVPSSKILCVCRHCAFSMYLLHACRQCSDVLPSQSSWCFIFNVSRWHSCFSVNLGLQTATSQDPISHFTKPKSNTAFLKSPHAQHAILQLMGQECATLYVCDGQFFSITTLSALSGGVDRPPYVKAIILRDKWLCIFHSEIPNSNTFTLYKNM